jgi:SAM-dependent methyltransferase
MNANTNSASPSEPAGSGSNPATDPVNWEERYVAGDTPWDKGSAAPPLTGFLARHPITGRVLVPGCGPGHDVRAISAQEGVGAEVTGLDLSETALRFARGFPAVGSEIYEQGDLFALPREWDSRFDWVVEHTCFCAIPPVRRADYVTAISRVLKPGGRYLAIFFLDPGIEQGPPHGATREEIERLFSSSFELIDEWLPSAAFEGREGRELCQLRRKVDRLKTEDC